MFIRKGLKTKNNITMKKILLVASLLGLMGVAVANNYGDGKKGKKCCKSEKKCCSKKDKKSCDKDSKSETPASETKPAEESK
jgi:hypothetical protein